jgi:hypothetical protein
VNASRPIPVDHLTPELDQFVSHRGDTFVGEAGKYIDQIAQNYNLRWWISETGLTVASIEPELALSRFDTLAGELMAKHFREGWLGNGSLAIIAKDLDDAGLSLRDSLEPSFRKKIGLPSLTEPAQPGLSSAEVFFLFELTAPINASEVLESTEGDLAVYRCSVPDVSTAWLKSKTQLDELARKAREMFESASIRYPHSQRWHILYAGPAPGGIVVGQQLNPTMIPTVRLYEFQRPRHIPSITITPQDSSLTSWTAESPLTSNTSKDVPT